LPSGFLLGVVVLAVLPVDLLTGECLLAVAS
jgi:hypothetical protein